MTLFAAAGCHLCDRAREELEALRPRLGFELVEVDIGGRPELERAYRSLIPVIEVEGERVSVYRVEEQALRARIAAVAGPEGDASQTPGRRPSL